MRDFNNQSIVITGAGSGLGKATALRFARAGWSIAVADLNQKRGEVTVDEITLLGGTAFFQRCDVAKLEDIQALHEACEQRWGGVDVLVNNAGIASSIGPIDHVSMEEWQRIIDINLMGVVRGCHVFSGPMKKRGSGHIVNIASIAGITSTPLLASYNAAKAAVIALSETLRWELKDKNIGVTVVCPALFPTNLTESIQVSGGVQQAMVKKEMAKSKLSADDIAGAIYDAVLVNKFMLLPHKATRLQWWLKRLSPDMYQWFYSRQTAKKKPGK